MAPFRAPSGSVLWGNRSVTARVRSGQRVRSPALAPTPPRAGPENVQCRAAFTQFQRAMVPGKRRRFQGPTRF